MRILTEDAHLRCKHGPGRVEQQVSQGLVTIGGRRVLVRPDPEHRPVKGCPGSGPPMRPCTLTDTVRAGYCPWIRIDGRPVCLSTVVGRTNGDPVGAIDFLVAAPGQSLVDVR